MACNSVESKVSLYKHSKASVIWRQSRNIRLRWRDSAAKFRRTSPRQTLEGGVIVLCLVARLLPTKRINHTFQL